MNASDINRYIGLPYLAGGRGPEAFDCWGLLLFVQGVHFGRRLPDLQMGDAVASFEAYESRRASGEWRTMARPVHGAPALMRAGMHPHVGTWLDVDSGGVLHAQEGVGVVWTPGNRLNMAGYGRVQYYEIHASDSDSDH
ncbi:peptidoglycan endopeptidase [Cupriavidus basilensis]|uniref:Peptidoglycan endopeptidase n=1 Tax=Cupriavidus basilensis TaxID=68895 RepID=A0ABT6AWZ7_9BURK|nr:peptidoglycan endopeptidase [Cupriavidus basilensis]MDF3837158.1 peptidoglycan endopeptidase [Cupriavidus basilensis]